MDLLAARRNVHSQNGEDGIIEAIFDVIGEGGRWACEFGAWDGIHFSNTRALIEAGWSAVLIEADPDRYDELVRNNAGKHGVHTFNCMVDSARLERCLAEAGAPELDLLCVDIDGLDFGVLEGFTGLPRIICTEINAGHSPRASDLVSTALAERIGQPFGPFHTLLTSRGYQLVAYTGNAFYVRSDTRLPALSPEQAYDAWVRVLTPDEKTWLYHANKGIVQPFHRFHNPKLSRRNLGFRLGYVNLGYRLTGIRAKVFGWIDRMRSVNGTAP